MQVDEQLSIREMIEQLMPGVHGQGRLADTGHPVQRTEHRRSGALAEPGPFGQLHQLGHLLLAAGESPGVSGQLLARPVRAVGAQGSPARECVTVGLPQVRGGDAPPEDH